MKRAAVLIGVQKAAGFQELSAVWKGVKAMETWAKSQGMETLSITDEVSKVHANAIFDSIEARVDPAKRIEQLFVYFAGHGVNKNYNEYWLLSDASRNANAAVNVKGSMERALYCRVPHVVFISDACRTAVGSIQTAGIEGSIIFPNPSGGPSAGVDVFYATQLGEPAFEIADPANAASGFTGIYTEVLLEALRGEHYQLAEKDATLDKKVIRGWPLKEFLANELPKRVFRLTVGQNPRSQKPDAIIASSPHFWLSALSPTTTPVQVAGDEPDPDAIAHAELIFTESKRINDATLRMLAANNFVDIEAASWSTGAKRGGLGFISAENDRFLAQFRDSVEPVRNLDFSTRCGFRSIVAKITDHKGHRTQYESFEEGHALIAHVPELQTVSTLLSFSNGYHAILPAIGGFIATLRFQGDSLVDVSYEPADGSQRWNEYRSRMSDLRQLRAIVASSSRLGTFRIDAKNAETLARRMQFSKGIDPSLAIYAAHAYRDLGTRDRIEQMAQFMQNDLGIVLFDIALLAGKLSGKSVTRVEYVRPPLPLLSQSWALLPALNVTLPVDSSELQRHMHPSSLWTLYNDRAARLLAPLIDSGVIR